MNPYEMEAQEIYDAEYQVKYYSTQLEENPGDKELEMELKEYKQEVKELRKEYGRSSSLNKAVALLWVEELQRDNHPDYSYEKQMEILEDAVYNNLNFDFLKKYYYTDENAWKIVSELAKKNFTNQQFQDFISKIEPM